MFHVTHKSILQWSDTSNTKQVTLHLFEELCSSVQEDSEICGAAFKLLLMMAKHLTETFYVSYTLQ